MYLPLSLSLAIIHYGFPGLYLLKERERKGERGKERGKERERELKREGAKEKEILAAQCISLLSVVS